MKSNTQEPNLLQRAAFSILGSIDYLLMTLVILSLIYTCSTFAQDAVVTPPPGMDWVAYLIDFLSGLPWVGPFLVMVLKYVGIVAAVFTSASVFATTLLRIPEVIARWAGAEMLASKIADFHDKIVPWLDYLSVFNSKKKVL